MYLLLHVSNPVMIKLFSVCKRGIGPQRMAVDHCYPSPCCVKPRWEGWCSSLGLYSLRRRRLISKGIPIINLRRSSDRLRFIMGIPIPIRRRLLSEERPWEVSGPVKKTRLSYQYSIWIYHVQSHHTGGIGCVHLTFKPFPQKIKLFILGIQWKILTIM